MFFIFLSIFLGFAYFFLIMNYANAWKNLEEESLTEEQSSHFLSVVVPFKNEEKNLPQLLQALSFQSYKNFELILVDDHSTDNSLLSIEAFLPHLPIKIVKAQLNGKKSALKLGILQAMGDLIICTDADCIPSDNWLKSIVQYQEKVACDLIICPVLMTHSNTLFAKLQALEFTSLIVSGAGATADKKPIMCNGANLAFTPKVWQESIADLKEEEVSGDDMFLLLSVKKRGGKIHFLKSTEAIVKTAACSSLSEFFNQRKRWTSKSKSYTDWQVIKVALIVFLLSAFIFAFLIAGFFNPVYWKTALFLLALKFLADVSILMPSAKFFSIEKLLVHIPLLEVIYPFYVLATVLGGLFGKFRWK